MEGEKQQPVIKTGSEIDDPPDRPFDFVEEGTETALICESDPAVKEKIRTAMKNLGYRITEAATTRDAIKSMRFHVYRVVIVNENFGADQEGNTVLNYLDSLNMSTRRQIFVALISNQFHTADNMAAFNKSVNLIVNTGNMDDDIGTIIKRGVADNDAFYYVFKEILRKKGKI
jgi:ActR/RegA family two-component response regulator